MTRMAIAFDLDKCLGCHACVVACRQQNHLPAGSTRNKVLRIGPSTVSSKDTPPHLEMYFLPLLCQHCESPRCVQVCPTGAAVQRKDGVVLIDKVRCINCRFCVTACPYGQIYYNEEDVIEKCTLCVDLTDHGQKPACVKVCMANCISFGDLDDPESEISRAIQKAGSNLHAFMDSGNKPTVRYIMAKNKAALRGF
jgi:Fe-S-cluster-containing dehydrogenase component